MDRNWIDPDIHVMDVAWAEVVPQDHEADPAGIRTHAPFRATYVKLHRRTPNQQPLILTLFGAYGVDLFAPPAPKLAECDPAQRDETKETEGT